MAPPMKAISWSEPGFFKVQERNYRWPPKYAHFVFAIIGLFFAALPWLSTPRDGVVSCIGVPIIGVLFGAVGGYGISYFDFRQPAMVSIDRNGFCRMDSMLNIGMPLLAMIGYRSYTFYWRQISHGRIDPCADARLKCIVSIFDENNCVLDRAGVPASVDIERIKAFFHERSKPLADGVSNHK